MRIALLAAVLLASAAHAEPIELTATPTRVAMFKNGYGVVSATAPLPDQPGPVRVAPLPNAALGSLWLGWPEGVEITGVTSRYADRSEAVPAGTLPQMIQANLGQTADVMVHNEWLTGVLRTPDGGAGEISLLLLEQNGQSRVIPVGQVQQLRLAGDPVLTIDHTTPEPVLDFDLTTAADQAQLGVTYMAAGITWAPSYRVDITDDTNARLSAKAVIVNDLIDLDGIAVELVTGFPHLQYAHAPTAMSLVSLDEFIRSFSERGRYNQASIFGNQLLGQSAEFDLQAALSNTNSGGEGGGMPSFSAMGQTVEDLFFYQIADVTLKKGERGYFPLFAAETPYRHVYTWKIRDFVDEDNRYRRRRDDGVNQPEVVWHAIRLTNTTDQPWTTAPAQTVQGGRVLGQDTLRYTAPGGTTDLRITQALSIRAEQNEYETARERNAARFHGSSYDKVTVRGELAITNFKDRPVTVDVVKVVSGEILSAADDPEVAKLTTGLRRVNPRSQLKWSIRVDPGKEKTVKVAYSYEVFVRN